MKRSVELTFNECEILLLLWRGRELQQLGCFADSARQKLSAARNSMHEELSKDKPSSEIQSVRKIVRNGEFNIWNRMKETMKEPDLPLFEHENNANRTEQSNQ
jgi:hypothetical protein